MARPKTTFGLYRVTGPAPREVGPIIEKFTDLVVAMKHLTTVREAEKAAGGNPYDLAILPVGPKGEGLLGPGM